MKNKKIVFIIPAHLNSVRLPKKILLDIKKLPLIEHVRRRILYYDKNAKVYIATPDKNIKDLILNNGGNVIQTSKKHLNGTSRISEAIKKIDCSHVILIQGDEPLLLPSHLKKIYNVILNDQNNKIWNATAGIDSKYYNTHSMVKCALDSKGMIHNLFRKITNQKLDEFSNNKLKIRKILGIIGFDRKILEEYKNLIVAKEEINLSVEQIRYLKNGIGIKSISIKKALPSINEKKDLKVVLNELNNNYLQKKIYNNIISEKT